MNTKDQLFVRQSIEIQAPSEKVWQVLTDRELTRQWVSEFFGQAGELVSEWKLGSPVEWKMLADGKTYVEGNVTAIELHRILRYTVFDTRSEHPSVTEEDGITFTLSDHVGRTELVATQGDFGKMDDGEKYYNLSVPVWERALPKIKAAAEMA